MWNKKGKRKTESSSMSLCLIPAAFSEQLRALLFAREGGMLVHRVVLEFVRRKADVSGCRLERADKITKHISGLHDQYLIWRRAERRVGGGAGSRYALEPGGHKNKRCRMQPNHRRYACGC